MVIIGTSNIVPARIRALSTRCVILSRVASGFTLETGARRPSCRTAAGRLTDLVCDGVLPIDQMREHTGPIALVVKRIPKAVLDATYGLDIRTRSAEEGGNGQIVPEDLLVAYASE